MLADENRRPAPGPLASFGMEPIPGDAELEPDVCWQAMRSRDRRFDGRFFVAAVTTRIYCRPICPVPFAKPNNISLFPCAAAAEAAGFRPCHRCRPESAPGTPAWTGTSAVVSRALRLIWEGSLDGSNIEELAERVGIGSRQLRRLFIQHLGVPPIKIAATHRLHFARNLIEQTNMPMGEIALSAGFKSVRAFNHAVLTTAGQSPSELRRLRDDLAISSASGELALRLLYRPPFNWPAMMAFLGARAIPGVEAVQTTSYRRTVESEGEPGIIDVRPDQKDDCLIVRITLRKYEGLLRVVERVRRLFDLGADPLQIEAHLSRDPRLKPFVERRPGLRVPGIWDGFEAGVRAALGESLTIADSNRVAQELVQKFGRPIDSCSGGLTHLFPRPEDLAETDLMTVSGMSPKSAFTIKALAHVLCSRELAFDSARTLQDTTSQLSEIDGISEGMAHYIAMRALGEPDAFPFDKPVQAGFWGDPDELPAPSEVRSDMADAWRPWRAYAAMHLWAAGAGI